MPFGNEPDGFTFNLNLRFIPVHKPRRDELFIAIINRFYSQVGLLASAQNCYCIVLVDALL